MDKDSDNLVIAHQIALRVVQDSLGILAPWASATLKQSPIAVEAKGMVAMTTAKQLVVWPAQEVIGPLRVVFDAIHLEQGQTKENYWPAWAITNTDNARDPRKQYPKIPYPSTQAPSQDQIQTLKQEIKSTLESLTAEDWDNLSLLMLVLEKYGSYLSFGQPDVAFFDQVKATAAVAAALAKDPDAPHLCLVSADLSGIQDFIYTISSDGAFVLSTNKNIRRITKSW
jgi:CRISPR-associated protein Csm1